MATVLTLAPIFQGLWRGHKQPSAVTSGHVASWFRSPFFYLFSSVGYFGFCWRIWRPFPWTLSRRLRAVFLILGSLFYFPGLALVLWGRLELGRMYNVSSGFGAQLYARHQLVTSGPFAYVRHPMYLGILLTALGGLLLHRTWTFLFLLAHAPVLMVRAHHEEQALAAAFGVQWRTYCRRVPRWLPRLRMP